MGANRTNTEQFQLRLPPGLRDRIKAYADLQGRSTNAEIVRVLEREFPEPEDISSRVSELIGLTTVLKGASGNAEVERLTSALIDTVRRIAEGTIQGVDEDDRNTVASRLSYWEETFAEDESTRATEGLDEVEIEALHSGLSTAKYPLDREWRRHLRAIEKPPLTESEEDAYERGFNAAMRFASMQSNGGDLDEETPK